VVNEVTVTVTVTRPRHPLVGRRLRVLGQMCKLGRDELLVELPDGSKTLMPAAWTDRDAAAMNEIAAVGEGTPVVAVPADLLHACGLVSDLRARAEVAQAQAASTSPCEEDEDAACAAQFDAGTDSGATTGRDRVAAPDAGRRGGQGPGPADRPSRGGADDGGRR